MYYLGLCYFDTDGKVCWKECEHNESAVKLKEIANSHKVITELAWIPCKEYPIEVAVDGSPYAGWYIKEEQ